jgi:PKD repeat protein
MNDNKLIKNSLFLMFVISINCVVNAQQKSSSVFEIKAVSVNKESEKNLSTNFEEYSLFTMDTESLNRHAQANLNKELLLDLELPGIEKMNIVLRKSNILSKDYKTIIATESKKTVSNEFKHITFEGNVTNEPNSIIRLTITKDIVHGIISTHTKEYFIEPLHFLTGEENRNIFVVYETEDLILDASAECGVTKLQKISHSLRNNNRSRDLGDCFRVEIVLASDESSVSAIGGSSADMEVYNIALMNTVVPYFKDFEFDTNVELVLTGQYISTSTATDPYLADCTNCTINEQLEQFRDWGNNGGFGSINYDLAHNITNHFPPPGTVGLAYIGVVGSSNFKYGVSNIVNPTWLTFIHELGHNFGMDHSFDLGQGSTGGFMDYGDGTYNGAYSWNPQYTFAEFEAEINSANIPTCSSIGAPIADFQAIDISCVGNTIEFTNYSLGGAQNYSWSFQDGTPSASTEISPSVTYSTTGQKSVSLTANNINGPDTITKNIIITNGSIAADCSPSVADPQNSNDGGSTFFQLNTISKTSGGSRSDGGYYQDYTCTDNTILELNTTYNVNISHLYQSSQTSYNVLFIDYNNDGDFTDANEIAYSGTDLSFSITTPGSAVVENEMLRARLSVQIFSNSNDPCYQPNQNLAQIEDYGVYFYNSSTFGNVETPKLTFSVYPNPSKDGNFTVNLPYLTKETQIFIYNALGQLVFRSTLDQKGENRIQLNSAIASGVYHIKLSLDDKMVTKKLIVQ